MSITFSYYRLSSEERESVTRDQAAWGVFLKRIQSTFHKSRHDAIAAIEGMTGSPEEKLAKLGSLLRERHDPRRFDLHKGWHTVGYLLTGQNGSAPQDQEGDLLYGIVFGGSETSVAAGYGPVTFFDQRTVFQSADALRQLDRSLVIERFDPERMSQMQIYTVPAKREQDGCLRMIDELADFFQEAATAGEEVIKFAV